MPDNTDKMQTIIACTDFSVDAANAMHYAAALAKVAKARLVLFHYFTYPPPTSDLPKSAPVFFIDEMAATLENSLREIRETLEHSYQIEVTCMVRFAEFHSDLEEVFQLEQADLVVMGMQGESVLINMLFGNMATAVIRRGRLPLLIVPRDVHYRGVQKILFPCNDYTISNPHTVRALRELAIAFDAYIEVLTLLDLKKISSLVPNSHISPTQSSLETLLKGTRHGYSYENATEVEKGILYAATASAADIVAMSPHHHTYFSDLLNQSTTQRIAANIELPLLVLGEKLVGVSDSAEHHLNISLK